MKTSPLPWSPPFQPPWKRALPDDVRRRLTAWCDELVPGVEANIVEWVGADLRYPNHAVVFLFPATPRSPIVVYQKVEDLQRHHLVRALGS